MSKLLKETSWKMERDVALTDEQIELLQAFLDDEKPGVYDAYVLIPTEYRKYFKGPRLHGADFKLAIDQGRFNGIVWLGISKHSKHHRYALHGAAPTGEALLH